MSWSPSGKSKVVPRRGHLHLEVAFQGEWTSLENIREGFIANVALLHLKKKNKLKKKSYCMVFSEISRNWGGSQPAPELDPSLSSPCGRTEPREGACCVSPAVPRLLLSAPKHPEQTPQSPWGFPAGLSRVTQFTLILDIVTDPVGSLVFCLAPEAEGTCRKLPRHICVAQKCQGLSQQIPARRQKSEFWG